MQFYATYIILFFILSFIIIIYLFAVFHARVVDVDGGPSLPAVLVVLEPYNEYEEVCRTLEFFFRFVGLAQYGWTIVIARFVVFGAGWTMND